MTQQVQIIDRNRTPAHIDDTLGHLAAIETTHTQLHQGTVYCVDHIEAGLADAATVEVLIRVPAEGLFHTRFSGACGGDATLYLFEGPTVTSAGTGMTAVNRHRISTNISTLSLFHTPSTSSDGVLLGRAFVPGGTVGNSVGGSGDIPEEWVLNNDTDYLFRVTNNAGNAKTTQGIMTWYEVDGAITT